MSDKDDGLPFKYKELIFVLLDLLAGNLDGAHLHLARRTRRRADANARSPRRCSR